VRLSTSVTLESVEPHTNVLLRAEIGLERNCRSCVGFLRKWLRYGTIEVLACASFISYPSFSRLTASRDLKDQASRLQNERVEVAAYTSIQTRCSFLNNLVVSLARRGTATSQCMRKFNTIHKKTLSSLQKVDDGLDILLAYLTTCITQMDIHSTFPVTNIKRLQTFSHSWLKKRDVVRCLLMVLPPVSMGSPTTSPTLSESP
jgi:hypothetical protein